MYIIGIEKIEFYPFWNFQLLIKVFAIFKCHNLFIIKQHGSLSGKHKFLKLKHCILWWIKDHSVDFTPMKANTLQEHSVQFDLSIVHLQQAGLKFIHLFPGHLIYIREAIFHHRNKCPDQEYGIIDEENKTMPFH